MQEHFVKNVDELVKIFNVQKVSLFTFIKKNFREDLHFILEAQKEFLNQRGGHNCIHMWLTVEAFDLVKNTYNL